MRKTTDKLKRYTVLLPDSLIKRIEKKCNKQRIGLSPYLRKIIIESEHTNPNSCLYDPKDVSLSKGSNK